jgi:hypothetical protein
MEKRQDVVSRAMLEWGNTSLPAEEGLDRCGSHSEKHLSHFERNMVTSFLETLYTAINAKGHKIVAACGAEKPFRRKM